MKWLLSIPLLLGVAGAWAGQPPDHTIVSGDTLGKIAQKYGYDYKVLGAFNGLTNLNMIKAGATIRFPARTVSAAITPSDASCITLGAAPFNPDHVLKRTLQGIDLLQTLTPEQKELAKKKVLLGEKATQDELVGQQIFKEMLYQSKVGKKEVVHVFGKPICNPEEGGQPEVMDTYDLGEGVFLSIPRRCGNPSVFTKPVKPKTPPPPPPAPPASAPTPGRPASAPVITPPPPAKVVVDKVASEYDWDAGLYVGGDKDVGFGGGEGAGYPLIRYYDWGRYALGGGGFFGGWQGGTSDGYHYSGENVAFGVAQKFSFANRRDLGIKFPMYGEMWTKGRDKSGSYQQRTHMSMLCAALSYTDASREKEGKTVLPEWQVWASFCDPFSQQKSHTRFGQTLDSSTIQDVKYVAGVGARAFLSKNLGDTGLAAKVQPFVEIGVNHTAPNPLSAHAYVGLRTVDKVWGCGVGIHHAETGNLPGATCTYDVGRDVKLRDQQERWSTMVKSLEALGVAVD